MGSSTGGPGVEHGQLGRRRFLLLAAGTATASIVGPACTDGSDGSGGGETRTSTTTPSTLPEAGDPSFIVRLETSGSGPRLAVKDLIDVAGIATSAGSRAVAASAEPAARDAACLAGARAAGARIVGKTTLSELAYSPLGLNATYGNPVNPLDRSLVPGGSSSGSAVAVATGAADVALGTDTGGSVRIPAACCGVAGLKTTFGRVSTRGVRPLAVSFDSVGPIAADVDGLALGMRLLQPSFREARRPAQTVGRVRLLLAEHPLGIGVDPRIDAAVDEALAASVLEVIDVDLVAPQALVIAFATILYREGAEANRSLLEQHDLLEPLTASSIEAGMAYDERAIADARKVVDAWSRAVDAAFASVDLLALPTLAIFPPSLAAVSGAAAGDPTGPASVLPALTSPWNAAGVPALALPIPAEPRPTSLQLVGPKGAEELLLPTARVVERAIR